MKYVNRVLIVVMACVTAISCQKAPSAAPTPKALTADAASGFEIAPAFGLYAITDGVAKWSAGPLLLGEKVALTGNTAKAKTQGRDRDYVEVKRDSGTTGWAWADFIVSNATLAVVGNEDAILYDEPKNTAATARSIPKLSVLVADTASSGQLYAKITWYDPVKFSLVKGVYVRGDAVSTKPDDVQSVVLLQLAAAAKDPKQKQARSVAGAS